MTRWPVGASASLTPAPRAATTPHGSWPATTGPPWPPRPSAAAALPTARYGCRSLPHMPEAFMATTTSPGPGVGSGNSRSSSFRPPRNTTPRISGPPRVLESTAASVASERRDPFEALPFVQADGGALLDAGLQTQGHDIASARVGGQVVEHQLAVTQAAKLRPNPHAFDLAILCAEQLDPATSGRSPVVADDEERDRVGNQLLHAEAMTALAWIERRQIRIELCDQRRGFGACGGLRCYDGRHGRRLLMGGVSGWVPAATSTLMCDAAVPRRGSRH